MVNDQYVHLNIIWLASIAVRDFYFYSNKALYVNYPKAKRSEFLWFMSKAKKKGVLQFCLLNLFECLELQSLLSQQFNI